MSKTKKATNDELVKVENAKEIDKIQTRELESLEDWRRTKSAPMALNVAIKMYELFLNGYSCEEIYRVNGGKFHLGQIVDAKQRYEWEKRRDAQLESIYTNIEQKVYKTKNDAIVHITDTLSAAHKLWGDKIKLFLQEGDKELLEGMDLENLKTYKELLQMLQALTTAADKVKEKQIQVDGVVNHVHKVELPEKKQLSSEEASRLLDFIDGK